MGWKPLLVVGLGVTFLWAQDRHARRQSIDDGRLKIAVVLSGGGAMGLAHIGVLKVLEEHRIPIDAITGTSMGAIVAGLYASGYSAQELEALALNLDWEDLLSDHPSRRQLPFRRKENDLTYLSRFELGFNRGSFQLRPGLIAGQRFGFLLQALTAHTSDVSHFDQLAIPFRAVATDLNQRKSVVLEEGNLGLALRASMSVPGIFSPVALGDQLFIDGGIFRNLPVDVAWSLKPDIVIAVRVFTPTQEDDSTHSLLSITSEVVAMVVEDNENRQAALADHLIEVPLEGFSSTDFHRVDALIPLGEAQGLAFMEQLLCYQVSEATYGRFRQQFQRTVQEGRTLDWLEIAHSGRLSGTSVLRHIQTRAETPLDLETIAKDLGSLYATGRYEKVDFLLQEQNQKLGLMIRAQDKSWGPNILRFGMQLFADLEGQSAFNTQVNSTWFDWTTPGSQLQLGLTIGETPQVATRWLQPLRPDSPWFATLSASTGKSTAIGTTNEGELDLYRVTQEAASLECGAQLGRFGQISYGILFRSGRGKSETSPETLLPN